MDHPLLSENQKRLRQRVVQFFEKAYSIRRSSSIVFVCGGNDDTHMRMLFRQYCKEQLPEYEVFLPEAAMENVFSGEPHEPFDLAQFEELVGELSHAIIVFPEAPGSFAETGYFSAVKPLARKCVLVLDSNRQRDSSFISLGPAKKFASDSIFQLPIQLDYAAPAFEVIAERIRLIRQHKYRKTLEVGTFSSLSSFEISALLHEIVNLCSVATFDDVAFLMRALFKGHLSVTKIQRLMSVLVGASLLIEIGQYGHLAANVGKQRLLEVKEGFREEETEIRLALTEIYQNADPEFLRLVEESRDVN